MAFNGSGVFSRLYNWVTDRDNDVPITASRMDAEMDGMATGLSTCITKDGQTTITANIPFSGNKITGLGDPASAQDAATKSYTDGKLGDLTITSSEIHRGATDGSLTVSGGTSGDGAHIELNGSTEATDPNKAFYDASDHDFRSQNGGTTFLSVNSTRATVGSGIQYRFDYGTAAAPGVSFEGDPDIGMYRHGADIVGFATAGTTRVKIDDDGRLLVGGSAYTGLVPNDVGCSIQGADATTPGTVSATVDGSACMGLNRKTDDGNLIEFFQDGTFEGSISVSGTTVSYNGGHLARWFQFSGTEPVLSEMYKGTVLSNTDEMCVWPGEENEQLNKLIVSNLDNDTNVAGLYVAPDSGASIWSEDEFDDHTVAMTGDFIIRVASGVSVQRGDLMVSAGDGTARPQGDDIVRSSTIAKITSSVVSTTYPDGSFAVPCVVMAC